MQINLKTAEKQHELQSLTIKLSERLPFFVQAPCSLHCEYSVQQQKNYYLLMLKAQGEITVCCQRCLQDFPLKYTTDFKLALCHTDEQADQLMDIYESIVIDSEIIDLVEILTDELHLSCQDKHLDESVCAEFNKNI